MENYPKIILTDNYKNILNDKSIDAVVIATPIDNHYEVASESIAAKNISLLKNLSLRNSIQATNLLDLKLTIKFFY